MKKLAFSVLALLLITGSIWGQVVDDAFDTPGQKQARVEAAKKAFITDRLGFLPEESEQFWALQNEFEGEQQKIRQKYAPKRAVDSMSDAEAEQFIENRFKMEEEMLALKKRYYPKFKAIVAPSKIALYAKAEREFRRYILDKLKEERRNNPVRRPGNKD